MTAAGDKMGLASKFFGTHSQREVKRLMSLVRKVESYDEAMQALTDERLSRRGAERKASSHPKRQPRS